MRTNPMLFLLFSLLLVVPILGCPEDDDDATDDDTGDDDTGDDDTGDDDDDDDDDTGDDDTGDDDTGDDDGGDDDTFPPQDAVGNVSWALHTIESMVLVSWDQLREADTYVEYRFDKEPWAAAPTRQLATGAQEQLVIGIPYDRTFTIRVSADPGDGLQHSPELKGQTGALPVPEIQPTILVNDTANQEPTGTYLITSINTTDSGWHDGDYWMHIFDRQGRVIWAYPAPNQYFCTWVRISRNGEDILWDKVTYWTDWDGGLGGEVHRMKLDGVVTASYPIPGANHSFNELNDGSIAWWAMDGADGHLKVTDPKGKTETLFSCLDFYDQENISGSCLCNTTHWVEATDTFYVSFAMRDFIVEVDHATATVLRQYGDLPNAYAFDPPESQFWVNHGPSITDAGTFLVSTHANETSNEGVVREYTIDDKNQTLHQIWSYGEGEGVDAYRGGEAHRLPGGNTLHNYGTTSRIKEVTTNGTLVWDVTWPVSNHLIGRSIFIEDLYQFMP